LQVLIFARLFNASKHGRLLYEETLPNYWLKLQQSAKNRKFCGTTFWWSGKSRYRNFSKLEVENQISSN
jgi:hypothetical protein